VSGADNVAVILNPSPGSDATLRNVFAAAHGSSTSSSFALRIKEFGNGLQALVENSVLVASIGSGGTANAAVHLVGISDTRVIHLFNSTLSGDVASLQNDMAADDSASASASAEIVSSKLIGPVQGDGTLAVVCTDIVYNDAEYLAAECPR
jgi:shikimate 5-dehydrogenase